MKHGHVTGTRRTRPSASAWYAAIAEATLARLERNDIRQEVEFLRKQAAGTTTTEQRSTQQGASTMPSFTPKTVNDPSNLTHGRHPAFLLAIVEEAIPEGWEMGKKDTAMFRWHLAIWEHPDHLTQYAPEQQSAISSRAFSPKGKFQASKAYVWSCALLGKEIPRGQGVDLDPLLPLACWADVARTPGNDYAKIEALWGRPEGQSAIPPIVHQLKAQYATDSPAPSTNGQQTPQPPAAYTVTKAGAQPQAPSAPPAGWPGAARPAQSTQQAQPDLPKHGEQVVRDDIMF